MKIRREQLAAITEPARRERFANVLRGRGFDVKHDPSGTLLVQDAEGRKSRFQLGSEGDEWTTTITSATGRTVKLCHNKQGELRKLIDPGGLPLLFDRQKEGCVETLQRGHEPPYRVSRDEQGRLQEIAYPDDAVVRYKADAASRTVIDRQGQSTRYEFNTAGNISAITDARGHATRFDHEQGQLARRVTLADGTVYDFEFDDEGQLSGWKVNGLHHARYQALEDEDGVQVDYQDGHRVAFVVENDRIVETRNAEGVLKLKYGEGGQLLQEEFNGRVVGYVYDKTKLLTAIVTPDGEELRFERDAEGRVQHVVDWTEKATTVEYHQQGFLSRLLFPNGVVTQYDINAFGLDTGVHSRSPAGLPLVSQRYTRDNCDRITGLKEGTSTREFRYDREERLLGVRSPEPEWNETFELDATGNCLGTATSQSQYNSLNQLTRYGGDPVSHDALGRMTAGPTPKGMAASSTTARAS